MAGDTLCVISEKTKSVPPCARSATKLARGACPRKGRQPRRSGCAVRPRRTTEHGEGVLPVRRAGRRESDKGLAVQTEPQAPVARAAFSAATSDPRAASGVLVARLCGVLTVRLRARSCACPPRLGSPLSRDETLPGTGPLQRRSDAKVFARRCTRPVSGRRGPWRAPSGSRPTSGRGGGGTPPGSVPSWRGRSWRESGSSR